MSEEIQKPKEMSKAKANIALRITGFDPVTLEEAWRFSEALAASEMIPERFQNKPGDCLIVLDLAKRLNCSWLAVMQHVYSVYGIIGMEAVLVVGLVNQSGLYVDPLEYEVQGNDAFADDYKVRACATSSSTGTVLHGPWIDWKLVKGEGWSGRKDRKGNLISKWLTMPEQMFHYRAASWFQRRHCPEVTMGMLTTDNITDMPRKHVDSRTFDVAQKEETEKIQKEAGSKPVDVNPETKEPAVSDKEAAATKAKADAEKAKLVKADKAAKAKAAREAKKKAKSKDALPKYHCDGPGCKKPSFNKPNATDQVKGSQCPNCFSWSTHLNEQPVDSAILAEND